MTVKDLKERLSAYPEDTVLYVFNAEAGERLQVTSLLYTPPRNPLDENNQRIESAYLPPSLEFTDDP
jgi:hypothetical protein